MIIIFFFAFVLFRPTQREEIAMNDVVFVMANSKLAKKKKTRKPTQNNIDLSGLWKMSISIMKHWIWMKTWF